MKKLLLLFFILPLFSLAGNKGTDWSASLDSEKRFIENKSQFDGRDQLPGSKILFGVDGGPAQIYFTKNGLTYRLETREKKYKEDEREKERESKNLTAASWAEKEKKEHEIVITTYLVHMQWANANPNAEVVAEDLADDYFSYTKANRENINHIRGYKKIVYKNLYPNIDVEYIFHPQSGLKYSLILHPGADPSQVKMIYSDAKNISSDSEGNLHFRTVFGDILDHAPVTFYLDNKSSIISSSFVKNGKEISFHLGNYDNTKTVVIDPWLDAPTFPGSNWNCVWECERDGAGNVYVMGGTSPVRIKKYTAAGAFQWTYVTPYDTSNSWLGTIATDLAGNTYIADGSAAAIQKINNAAGLVWDNPNPGGTFTLTEFWNIAFNCDQTKLIIGGTGGAALGGPIPYIFDVDMNSGNITKSVAVTAGGPLFGFPPKLEEVRAITSCGNSKYYFLTQDSIGFIHQSLSTCLVGGKPFHVDNGMGLGYKCENYRRDNSGIMALSYYNGFVFVNRGNQLQKRDFNTAAVVATVAIPGGTFNNVAFSGNEVQNSGIDIDACGNIYVGSKNAVYKFDQSLVQTGNYPTTFNVYDVEVNSGGEIIACGSTGNSTTGSRTGTIQSIPALACATQSLVCCDATVCQAGPFCTTDPALNLTASTAGGTWSGTGITNTTTGTFDPSVSGTGTFTITYSIACGSESIKIVVKNCSAPPSVCLESNGDLTAVGGVGPYHWDKQSTTQDCSACLFPPACQPPVPGSCPKIVTGWTTYSTSTTATPPGTWPIRLVDNSGNSYTVSSTAGLTPCGSSNLSINTSSANTKCSGQCTGVASVTASTGTAPYTYNWSGGQTTSSVTGLCVGTYSVLVKDATNATKTATVNISQPNAIALTSTTTPASCGSNDGSIVLSTTGGTGAITYNWNPGGQSTSTVTGMTAGIYTVTVTDGNGCTLAAPMVMSTTPGVTVSASPTDVLCNGAANGSASANATSGTNPYAYSWNNGQTTSVATGLAAGTYTVLVTDASGCNGTQTVSISEPAAITTSVSVTGTNCGTSVGSAAVTASGGTGTLSYAWNPGGQNTSSVSNLAAGTYSCTITDGNGCTRLASAVVNNLNGPVVNIPAQINVTCFGGSDGAAASVGSNGTGPYSFAWNTTPVQSTANATGLGAGPYTVVITDATGCTNSQTVMITEPAALTASVTTTAASCGNSDGSATANISGGTGPYSYSWTSLQSTQTASGLSAGSYSVIVTDAKGCSGQFSTLVVNSNGPSAVAGTSTTIMIGGSAQLTSSGGATYVWSPSATLSNANVSDPTASPDSTTTYCVHVTDANGCTDSACVTIFVEAACGNYFLPNAFSPNGDLENDTLQLYLGNLKCVKDFHLSVFDRWGEPLFDTTDPAKGWDGSFEGKIMDTQVVTYSLYILFADGKTVQTKGNVSLMR